MLKDQISYKGKEWREDDTIIRVGIMLLHNVVDVVRV